MNQQAATTADPLFSGLNDRSITAIPATVEQQRYVTSVAPKAANPGKWIEQKRYPPTTGMGTWVGIFWPAKVKRCCTTPRLRALRGFRPPAESTLGAGESDQWLSRAMISRMASTSSLSLSRQEYSLRKTRSAGWSSRAQPSPQPARQSSSLRRFSGASLTRMSTSRVRRKALRKRRRALVPEGHDENSPAFQRWDRPALCCPRPEDGSPPFAERVPLRGSRDLPSGLGVSLPRITVEEK